MLLPSVAQLPIGSVPKGEELLPPLCPHRCVLATCRCTDHLLPHQRLKQPRHKLIPLPSMTQQPIVHFLLQSTFSCVSPPV